MRDEDGWSERRIEIGISEEGLMVDVESGVDVDVDTYDAIVRRIMAGYDGMTSRSLLVIVVVLMGVARS